MGLSAFGRVEYRIIVKVGWDNKIGNEGIKMPENFDGLIYFNGKDNKNIDHEVEEMLLNFVMDRV